MVLQGFFSPTHKTPCHIHNPKCSIWTQRNEEWKRHHQYWTLLLADMNSLLWAPPCARATCQDMAQRPLICWGHIHPYPFMLLENLGLGVSWGLNQSLQAEKKARCRKLSVTVTVTLWVLNSYYKCRNLAAAETKKIKMTTKCKYSPLSCLLPHKI